MTSTAPVTSRIAEFATSTSLSLDTAGLSEAALTAFVDTVAGAIAGRSEAGIAIARSAIDDEFVPGRCTILTTGEPTTALTAAFLNGLSGHVHDFDDMKDPLIGHPSVALFPALLAVAQDSGRSGRELLDAYAVGYQIAVAIDRSLPVGPHFLRGWHSTSTVGVIAATAAVSRLSDLTALQTRHAIGIAASAASGSTQNFGTDTKSLHAARTARDAVLAVRLAGRGFTANPAQLESDLGYFSVFGDGTSDLSRVFEVLTGGWRLLDDVDRPRIKPYPSCGATHRPMVAALEIAPLLGGRLERVEAVRVTAPPHSFAPLLHHHPRTGLEGKFSAEYAVAAALTDGAVGLPTFTDAGVGRSHVRDLVGKITLHESEVRHGAATGSGGYAVVEVDVDGHTLTASCSIVPELDAGRDALERKVADCIRFARVPWNARALTDELFAVGEATVVGGFASMTPVQPL